MRPGEIIVDSFAGGGGASEGIYLALGRHPDIAINHDREAIALHKANHPQSLHYPSDVWEVKPRDACAGRPVGLMWLSPDCKHFSKAKGTAPVSPRVRGLAWVAVRWARDVRPRVIVLENVEEFQSWGPVNKDGRPCPIRKGRTFKMFVGRLRGLGYEVQWRELRACDYGAPTIRKRLFLIARCDGEPIAWPAPTHGPGRPHPWCTAAECIEWSLPCPSIFLTKEEAKAVGARRPLAEATLRRIARGVKRYVLDNPRPFIVQYHAATRAGDDRVASIDRPLLTQTTENRFGLVAPYLIPRYGEREGQEPRTQSVERPLSTIVPTQNGAQLVTQALVSSHLLKLRGSSLQGQLFDEPAPTITAGGNHLAEVRAFLVKYYGTDQDPRLEEPLHSVTTKDRFGLVLVEGSEYVIADIGMRMLVPRELYRAQGFRDNYQIEVHYFDEVDRRWKWLTKTAQVRMVGNSVCPPLAEAIVRANLQLEAGERAA